MKRTLLVINTKSANAQTIGAEELAALLRVAGFNIVKQVCFPQGELLIGSIISDHDIEVVAILSGDGTISSLCQQLDEWPGEILVLPGGTMNLFSRRLYGDLDLRGLLEKLDYTQMIASQVPVVRVGNRSIFTGITVGPCTRWGEVREVIRQRDVVAIAESVPVAWSETLAKSGVWIEGSVGQPYTGIFVEPVGGYALAVIAFRADNLGDMLGHGIAWLRRDFRDGPHDDLGTMRKVTIMGDEATTGVLIDGEVDKSELPLTCTAGKSTQRFLKFAA